MAGVGTLRNVQAVALYLKALATDLQAVKHVVVGIPTQIGPTPHVEVTFKQGSLHYSGAQGGSPPQLRALRFEVAIYVAATQNLDDAEIMLYGLVDDFMAAFWLDRTFGGIVETARFAREGVNFQSVEINQKLYRRSNLDVWCGDLDKEGL
jgi:hypothetical protein